MKTPVLSAICITLLSATPHTVLAESVFNQAAPTRDEVLQGMRRATQYMMDSVSHDGAFVWEYMADGSRRWGELEATSPTMVWLQDPGTPAMGQMLIDALHATGDDYYYEQALRVAHSLISVQHPEGGWNYVEDLEGEERLRQFYATVGRQAWRMEEFQYYYGNCTFDDGVTIDAASFLLRLYLERHDAEVRRALDHAIQFVLDSQYPNGGWPQRWPLRYDHSFQGRADYSPFITLNDNVMMDNVEFLLQCYQTLHRTDLYQPIIRAIYLLADLQQPEPLAGWADQYDPETLLPGHARSYEPRSVNTSTTLRMLRVMGYYYSLTGDKRFIRGFRSALRFVGGIILPREYESVWRGLKRDTAAVLLPRFVSPDDGRPLFVHRCGSNVGNGHYYTDQDLHGTIKHYSSAFYANLAEAEAMCRTIEHWSVDSLLRTSPLLHPDSTTAIPSFYFHPNVYRHNGPLPTSVADILRMQQPSGAWMVAIGKGSHPYRPMPHDQRPSSTDAYAETNAGDEYDTSPYYPDSTFQGVSTSSYIRLMARLADWLHAPSIAGLRDGIHHWNLLHRERNYPRLDEADYRGIADNLLAYQNPDGGWMKNMDWLGVLNVDSVVAALDDYHRQSTLDNRNTFPQIELLAQTYCLTGQDRYRVGAQSGLMYLLDTQKANGGWRGWDVDAITMNDEVTPGALQLMQRILYDDPVYGWIDDSLRSRIRVAYDRGIRMILDCQYVQDGIKTAWAQQHDNVTLLPTGARSFELPGLTANESCPIINLLMDIREPSAEVIEAVDCAVAWLRRVAISGLRVERVSIPESEQFNHEYPYDNVVVHDVTAPLIWARFYECADNTPFFCTRKGQKVSSLAEVNGERRTGYAWYGYWPVLVLERYEEWSMRVKGK